MPGLIAGALVWLAWDYYALKTDKEMVSTAFRRLRKTRLGRTAWRVLDTHWSPS